MNGVWFFPLISRKLLVGIEGRVYKSFPLFFFFVPTTSLEGQQIFVNQRNGKMAPFSPLVHAGQLSGEGYAHSSAPPTEETQPENQGYAQSGGASPCGSGAWDVWHPGDFKYSIPPSTLAYSKRMGLESDLWFQQHRHRKPRTSPNPSLGNLQT